MASYCWINFFGRAIPTCLRARSEGERIGSQDLEGEMVGSPGLKENKLGRKGLRGGFGLKGLKGGFCCKSLKGGLGRMSLKGGLGHMSLKQASLVFGADTSNNNFKVDSSRKPVCRLGRYM